MKSLIPQLEILDAGAGPLVAAMCQEIGLREIVDNMVKWDRKQCRLSPGTLIEALVVNVLTARKPLYRVEEFYRTMDLEVLFGTGVTSDALNDDALGRALSKLAMAHPKKVYLALALSAVKVHNVDVGTVHADTTSMSVYGAYEGYEEPPIDITYGFSKAHRPDLKQFLYGLIVNKDGIPLFGEVRDGNLNDKTWNQNALTQLDSMLPVIPDKSTYVADSALVTSNNLKLMQEKNIAFISRLPDTFGLGSQIKECAWEQNEWQLVGKLSELKNAAVYRIQPMIRELNGTDYRFIVVHSSALDARKQKSITRAIEVQRAELNRVGKELSKREFFCEPDAAEALSIFLTENKNRCFDLTGEIKEELVVKRKPGRPRKDEVPETRTLYHAVPCIGEVNEQVVNQMKAKASTFVLITSILSEEELSASDVLKEYKEQSAVENSFRFLKDPVYVDGIYVKKPERVVALGYVFLMALLIHSLLQRRVRMNLAQENEPLIIPGNKRTHKPTGTMLLDLLKPLSIIRSETVAGTQRMLPKNQLTENIIRMLRLAGFSEKIYCAVRSSEYVR